MARDGDKVCVVTGAMGAIGAAMTAQLARQGGAVVMVVRDEARAKPVRDAIAHPDGQRPHRTVAVRPGLARLGAQGGRRSEAAAPEDSPADEQRRRLLEHAQDDERRLRAGRFGTNMLAPFLFTTLLEEPLKAAGSARVVNLAMPAKNPLLFDDLMLEKKYDGMTA